MRWKKTLQVVEVHCEGEVGKVITSGVIDLPGVTMADKMSYINSVDSSLINMLLLEPRGCAQMAANLLLPPTVPGTDVGFLVLLADGAHSMSGSNCMCVVTALLETGVLPMKEPVTEIALDTPAGVVIAKATCLDGKCVRVSLEMPPAFVEHLDITVNTKEFGPIIGDIAFGGEYYLLVDVHQFGISIEPANASELVRIGSSIKNEFAQSFAVRHPSIPSIDKIASVMFREREDDNTLRTCTVGGTGRVDRSPCGTGNAANAAVLSKKGLLSEGESLIAKSIIGSEFEITLASETTPDPYDAVKVMVSGRCWIFGLHQIGLDPDDPFADGFALTDTWGPNIECIARSPKAELSQINDTPGDPDGHS